MKNYVAKCDNGQGICKMCEKEYIDWNGKCPYGKDGGVYCTAKFKEIEEKNDNKDMLEIKESKDICLCIHCKNETTKKISIHFNSSNTVSFSICDSCLTKLTKEFINYYIKIKE